LASARSWPNLRYIPAYVWRAVLLQKCRKNLQYNASNKSFVVVERLKYLTKAVCNQNSFKRIWSGIRSETGQAGGLRSSVLPPDIKNPKKLNYINMYFCLLFCMFFETWSLILREEHGVKTFERALMSVMDMREMV